MATKKEKYTVPDDFNIRQDDLTSLEVLNKLRAASEISESDKRGIGSSYALGDIRQLQDLSSQLGLPSDLNMTLVQNIPLEAAGGRGLRMGRHGYGPGGEPAPIATSMFNPQQPTSRIPTTSRTGYRINDGGGEGSDPGGAFADLGVASPGQTGTVAASTGLGALSGLSLGPLGIALGAMSGFGRGVVGNLLGMLAGYIGDALGFGSAPSGMNAALGMTSDDIGALGEALGIGGGEGGSVGGLGPGGLGAGIGGLGGIGVGVAGPTGMGLGLGGEGGSGGSGGNAGGGGDAGGMGGPLKVGGYISGSGSRELHKGEYVLPREAVDIIGIDNLEALRQKALATKQKGIK